MFANQYFSDFSQRIGLASLGATDAELKRLATIYWYTIEWGLCYDANGEKKVMGAGLMGSVIECEHSVSGKAELKPLDIELITTNEEY